MTMQSSDKMKRKTGSSVSERIMAMAKKLFFSYGIHGVSMDHLAKLSGVSKKTIYQYFEDKEVLVYAVVKDQIELHERLLTSCQFLANEAIDEVLMRETGVFRIWTDIHYRFFYDVEKYYPQAWMKLEQYSIKMQNSIIGNLERGKIEGLYRIDMDTVLIAELLMHQQKSLLRSEFTTSQKLSTDRLVKEITMLYLHSITSEKGKLVLGNYIKKESDKSTAKTGD